MITEQSLRCGRSYHYDYRDNFIAGPLPVAAQYRYGVPRLQQLRTGLRNPGICVQYFDSAFFFQEEWRRRAGLPELRTALRVEALPSRRWRMPCWQPQATSLPIAITSARASALPGT